MRIWKLDEANAQLPEIRRLLREQTASALALEWLHRRWERAERRDDGVRALEREIQKRVGALEAARRGLEQLGARADDPRSGSCELFADDDGKPVRLRVRHDD